MRAGSRQRATGEPFAHRVEMLGSEVRDRCRGFPRGEGQVAGVERGPPAGREDRDRHAGTHPGLGAADPLAQLGRGQPAVERHQPLDRPDLFGDGQVGAVDVLRQHRLDDLDRGHVPDDGGHVGHPGLDAGGVAAVPGDDPVHAVVVGGEHDERFQDAVRADRADQLGQITQAAAAGCPGGRRGRPG